MIQRDYILNNPLTISKVLGNLVNTIKTTPHKDALLTIYETGFPEAQIVGLIESIRCSAGKDLKIAGISLFAIADAPAMGKGIRLNLILTQTADIEVVTLPCDPGEEDSAIAALKKRLDTHPDAKAIQLFVCDMGLGTTRLMEEVTKGRDDIGIFGTMSSRKLPDTMISKGFNIDLFDVFNLGEKLLGHNQFAIGDKFLTDGFVAVIFSGKELEVKMNYALGWHPIGKEMPLTKGEKGKLGETCLTAIDGIRPVELYTEYLGVKPNKYFITNICEFPLMVQREGIDICLIPFDYGQEGEVYFNIALSDDEKLRFSYGTHDEVLRATYESCEDMRQFAPEALFLVMCGNRINFLQEEARLEWEGFKKYSPDYALIHGASELYYRNGKGGILNSAHLAIGMREGGALSAVPAGEPFDMNCVHNHKIIPLAERMSVFMSKMTTQLESMAEEAKAANLAKSAFLSNMSHEIRTPINAILGMDEMILRESNESGVVGYAEDIRSASNNLLGIINDILDFSKIEAGKMDIIPVEYEFASVINDLYNVIRKRAEDKGLEVKLDIDPAIPAILYGDEIRIKQVITNILTNAVKYTEKGSVTLKINKIVSDNDKNSEGHEECHGVACFKNPVCLAVSVTDTGIGIKKEDIKRLDTAFERVDEERNRTIEGTGLGLNITSQLLTLMDSELKVESIYGEGSTFSFVIVQGISRDEPIGNINDRWTKTTAQHKKYREKFTAPDAHILVVDDTKMNLDVVKNLLKKTRIGIDTAESGQEALDLVAKNAYDIIFLDHRMPNMDGIECFKRMKELPDHKCPDAPVISLTANAVSGAREEYLTTGFADYLTKPIDSGKLEDMLVRYLPADKVIIKKEDENKTASDISVKHAHYAEKPRIVLIDDAVLIHEVANTILGQSYRFEAYTTGTEAIKALENEKADLILLDVMMPDEDGFSVLEKIRANAKIANTPVVFLTGDDNEETEIRGFKAGAWDFVRKPFVSEVLLQRVRHTIDLSRLQQDLTHEVAKQTLRAEHLTQEVMLALSKAVDAKDHYTNGHSERVAGYATMLAAKLSMSDKEQADVHDIGLLHDIGKIGVPGEIINKPARLTDEEFAQIKKHPSMGYDILKMITELPELAIGARWHHERYDGKGYPDGKAGEEIPYIARIICVADSYDAMTSNRSYSKIRAQEEVRAEIKRCSGSQFDPAIADKMLQLIDEDTDYLMNEKGYSESRVANYVEELLERVSRSGKYAGEDEAPVAETDVMPEETDFQDDEEEKLPDWLLESKAVDANEGVNNCGSVEGYLSILTNFQSTVTEKADEIQGYYDKEDWENYTIKVHALKSSARIIGAAELSERARLLEAAGDARQLDVIKDDTPALLALYRSYEESLSPIAEQSDDLPEAPIETIGDAYKSLGEFVEAMDYETSRMVLDSMREYRLPAEDKERFDRLQTRLSQLDWDGMKFILKDVGVG
ncbi:MAG: response regulator [Lachnospiraceae bacterium]|nr:response regulator [Lachnospiraceae bacterium]